MVMVEADGNYIQPVAVDDLDIYSGESYSVLIHTDQDPSKNYWISVSQIFLQQNPGPHGLPKPPTTYNRRIILLNTQNTINGFTKWAINNISLTLPPTPYLGAIKHRLSNAFDQKSPPENFPNDYDVMKPPTNTNSTYGNGVYMLELRTTVDVILQNANALATGVSEIHPWHLHGHDFWVLGYGEGKFRKKDLLGLWRIILGFGHFTATLSLICIWEWEWSLLKVFIWSKMYQTMLLLVA
ncbi:hypothetical protein AAG906_006092 [Vitis piasezkii]